VSWGTTTFSLLAFPRKNTVLRLGDSHNFGKVPVISASPQIHNLKNLGIDSVHVIHSKVVMGSDFLKSVAYYHEADLLQHIEERSHVLYLPSNNSMHRLSKVRALDCHASPSCCEHGMCTSAEEPQLLAHNQLLVVREKGLK